MANVEYLICSFCQGPSSRLLRPKLAPHLSNPQCRIRSFDLDWLDNWRVLFPTHVEWDLDRLVDREFESEFQRELPKSNVVSKDHWVASIEGSMSHSPEWDDLDGWRTIEFNVGPSTSGAGARSPVQGGYEHLMQRDSGASGGVISKRTLHHYNDDINATRLPFHSACLRILYESCNEVEYSTYATSTVSDVVAAILLPSWHDGDVNMDWLSRKRTELGYRRLIAPWGEHWHPLDPDTNYLAVDPSRPQQIPCLPSMIIQEPRRTALSPTRSLPPLLRMPPEVLDLISDFLMDLDTSCLHINDPKMDAKVKSLHNLRYTCRQMYHHSFPRIHFLSFLLAECRLRRNVESFGPPHPAIQFLANHPHLNMQYQLHIPPRSRPYSKPLLPYRRIPALPRSSQIDRTVMETDWEAVYRSWKEGLGWKNRVEMFVRCEKWLGDMQEWAWQQTGVREWGRTANYVIPVLPLLPPPDEEENYNPNQDDPPPLQPIPLIPVVQGNGMEIGIDAAAELAALQAELAAGLGTEDEDMQDAGDQGLPIGDLEQFQWP